MNRGDAYIANAMLASLLTEEKKDYMSLLMPFVLASMPDVVGAQISVEDVQDKLNKEYNLDILLNVVESLMQRCCKEKNGKYVRKENGCFYVNKIYESKEFEEHRIKIKKSMECVVDALYSYIKNVKKFGGITKEKAQDYLVTFLDSYNYTVISDIDSMNLITVSDENAKNNYYVAQFIISENEKDSVAFAALIEIIKGTLIAKSIYYFMDSTNNLINKKMEGTSIYLDTSLLIDVLGVNYQYDNVAIIELVELAKSCGGYIKTFKHYVDELKGIIYKYSVDPSSRLNLSLNKFVVNKMSAVEARAFIDTIETRLDELGVIIEDIPDYSEDIKRGSWRIDYTELKKSLAAGIDYKERDGRTDALDNDANTIEAIAFLRGKPYSYSIFDCKAIFVTENADITNIVKQLYFKERFSHHEINFAISDVDLTAMLWLNSFGKKNELPKLKLIENAYAACEPSKRVISSFLKKIDNLEDSEKITNETALLLRTQKASLEDLVSLTENNENAVTDEIIKEMEARLHNRAIKESRTELKKEFKKLDDEKEIQAIERDEIESARRALINEKNETMKEKQNNEIVEARIQKKRAANEEIKRENKEQLDEINTFRNEMISNIKKTAAIYKKIFTISVYFIMSIVSIATCFAFAYATIWVSNQDNGIDKWTALVAGISIGGGVSLIYTIWKYLRGLMLKVAIRIEDKIYNKGIEKNKALLVGKKF